MDQKKAFEIKFKKKKAVKMRESISDFKIVEKLLERNEKGNWIPININKDESKKDWPTNHACVAVIFSLVSKKESRQIFELKYKEKEKEKVSEETKEKIKERAKGACLELVYIKRVSNERDRWSAQVAFPGGRKKEEGESLRETAERETMEEIGLNLENREKFVCVGKAVELHVYGTIKKKSHLQVNAFVYLAPFGIEREEIKVNEKEVDAVNFVPTNYFTSLQYHKNLGALYWEFSRFDPSLKLSSLARSASKLYDVYFPICHLPVNENIIAPKQVGSKMEDWNLWVNLFPFFLFNSFFICFTKKKGNVTHFYACGIDQFLQSGRRTFQSDLRNSLLVQKLFDQLVPQIVLCSQTQLSFHKETSLE